MRPKMIISKIRLELLNNCFMATLNLTIPLSFYIPSFSIEFYMITLPPLTPAADALGGDSGFSLKNTTTIIATTVPMTA